jgi:competence protein ComEA
MNSIAPNARLRRTAALLFTLLLAPALAAHAQDSKPRAPITPPSASSPAVAGPAAVSGVLNLNTANVEELARLPGVGPSRAQAIVELRSKMNGFKNVEDIMRVRGIGRKTFRKLEPMLRLQGATTLAKTRKPSPGTRAATAAKR